MNSALLYVGLAVSLSGCGSAPPSPKVAEDLPPPADAPKPKRASGTLQVSQELGSIDQRKVEETFAKLVAGPIEACHAQGRTRIEFLAGDVKVFLRIDQVGRVKYGFFEDTTLGDRETERCLFHVLANANWPQPEGGEAEVRSGFGWSPGGEREPTPWSSELVAAALIEARDVRSSVNKCKSGMKGDFLVTAYVEADEAIQIDAQAAESPRSPIKKSQVHSHARADAGSPSHARADAGSPSHARADAGSPRAVGRFKALGIAAPSQEGTARIDCLIDALKPLELPSPGSYPAKVTFSL